MKINAEKNNDKHRTIKILNTDPNRTFYFILPQFFFFWFWVTVYALFCNRTPKPLSPEPPLKLDRTRPLRTRIAEINSQLILNLQNSQMNEKDMVGDETEKKNEFD